MTAKAISEAAEIELSRRLQKIFTMVFGILLLTLLLLAGFGGCI